MTSYFSKFPVVDYNNNKQVLNITLSVRIKEVVSGAGYFYYNLKDGERPDTIANDYYGDSNLFWIVLLSNEVIDPYYGWLLSENDLNDFIIKKYGSLQVANSTIHHYKKKDENLYFKLSDPEIIIDATEYSLEPDKSSWALLRYDEGIEIAVDSYNLRVDKTNYTAVTAFDYEFNLNEEKRPIKILQRDFVQPVVSSLKEILLNG